MAHIGAAFADMNRHAILNDLNTEDYAAAFFG
jgi:hypothetical protein